MTATQPENTLPIIRFLQSEADTKSPRTAAAYRQAIKAYGNWLNSTADPSRIQDFIIHLALQGYSYKTSRHYLDILSSLINKYNRSEENGATYGFISDSTDSAFAEISPTLWDDAFSDDAFLRLLAMTKSASHQKGSIRIATDIILLSLLNGGLPVEKIVTLKITDTPSLHPSSKDIINRNADPRRKFIFPLDQSFRTPRQLREHVDGMIRSLLRLRNLPIYGSPDQTIRSYWAYTALRAGISPEEIVNTLGSAPAGFPALSVIDREQQTEATGNNAADDTITDRIAEILLTNPLHWYAMRLRPYISYTDLTLRLSQLQKDNELNTPPLFYPHDEIARRTGKKIEFEKKPVIRDIVFFNAHATDILPMFTRIGDLAWCYKTDGANGKTYAAIPSRAFERFQQTIGHFTPDYQVAPIGSLPPLPGEKVEIVAGPFAGREARFIDVLPADQANAPDTEINCSTLYRCSLIGDNGIEWRITLPSLLTAR